MDYIEKDFLGLTGNCILAELGVSVVSYEKIDSTNQAARRLAAEIYRTPLFIVADSQSAGRGRMGRSFYSPAQTGLYMTLLLDVTEDLPSSVVKITSVAAVAAALAIDKVAGVECKIKWVNDIYIDGKKVSGILAESFFDRGRRFVCVGVGVNICTVDFPSELREIAGTVGVDAALRKELAVKFCEIFLNIYMKINRGDTSYMDEYRRRSLVLGKSVVFTENGISREGIAKFIDDEGGLLINCGEENIILRSGEISLRLKGRD